MNEKQTSDIKYIVAPIIFVVVVAIVVGVIFGYNPFRLSKIKSQLKGKYGVEFTATATDIKGQKFKMRSADDGIFVKGTCDAFGNVKTESYVNYYYADECVKDIEYKIGVYFDECIIVADQLDHSELYAADFDYNSISSYDEYLATTKEKDDMFYHVKVRVYVREKEALEHIEMANDELEASDEYIWVYYHAVPDDYYDALKESGIYCFNLSTYMDEFENKYPDKYDEYFQYTYGKGGRVQLNNK